MKIPRKRRYGGTTCVLGFAVEAGMVTQIAGRGFGEAGRCWRMLLMAVGEFSSAFYTV